MVERDRQAWRADPSGRVVAVTGVCNYLGTELLRRLEGDRRIRKLLAVDIRRPDITMDKTEFCEVDLTVPTADRQLSQLFADHGVDTVVHGAFLSYPTHASEWAHELEDVGTMHILDACAVAVPERLVMLSTTLVYGASPKNPNFLDETTPLQAQSGSRFVADKVRAERQAERFAVDHPATRVCILRFAPILGPSVENLFTRFFARPVAPVLMGRDPLLQLLHENDAAAALEKAVATPIEGPVNIVGKGVLPYTTILALMGRMPVPMPHFLARSLSRAMWVTQIFDSPPSFLDFLRYPCVADGRRAAEELGFTARYSIKRTVHDFLGVVSEDGSIDLERMPG